jgi:hypothetical protein
MQVNDLQKLRNKRARLIYKRRKMLQGLRGNGNWTEFHALCEQIAKAEKGLRSAAALPRASATVARIFRELPQQQNAQLEDRTRRRDEARQRSWAPSGLETRRNIGPAHRLGQTVRPSPRAAFLFTNSQPWAAMLFWRMVARLQAAYRFWWRIPGFAAYWKPEPGISIFNEISWKSIEGHH